MSNHEVLKHVPEPLRNEAEKLLSLGKKRYKKLYPVAYKLLMEWINEDDLGK